MLLLLPRQCAMLLALLSALLIARPSVALAADVRIDHKPRIFWASAPVRPNETVMVQGSDLGPDAVVEMARLDDVPGIPEAPFAAPALDGQVSLKLKWERVPVLQESTECLKFVVPAEWKPGIFLCHVHHGGQASDDVPLNQPDVWWMQGDEGEAATPGGWLRVLGKCLAALTPADTSRSALALQAGQGKPIVLQPTTGDGYSLQYAVPRDLAPGSYTVHVHNGHGGARGWTPGGNIKIVATPTIPPAVFNVLDAYGADATREMRKTVNKYIQPVNRTEGILAALKKARDNGGGTVFFPAGKYTIKGTLNIPDHTLLKGEGMGVVTLWWGTPPFNMDGGGSQDRVKIDLPKPPGVLIAGQDFAITDLSFYLPMNYEQGIVADKRFRMSHVRVRTDRGWLLTGRGEGTIARMGENFQVTECDLYAKGQALVSGKYGLIANNRILSSKCNTPLGGAWGMVVENNQFVGMDPTAYQNIGGWGRNIYYGHNRQESIFVHQADYSFTFDASAGAYLGGIASTNGIDVTLTQDPVYPKWAMENSALWKRSVICILAGRGAGQWRDVQSNRGKQWTIDRPFDTAPDATSIATIVPFSGRVLIVGNHFEDAAWVNAGYGTSIDVICANNDVIRTASLMNFGVHAEDWYEPSWYVQYFDNTVSEGQTNVESSSGGQKSELYSGPMTAWAVHRRQTLTADNGGEIRAGGKVRDVIIEGCTVHHPMSTIKADSEATGVLLRNNHFDGVPSPRYEGDGLKNAVVVPPLPGK